MNTASLLQSRSSKLVIHPLEEIEIDLRDFRKPMNDDDFFNFCQKYPDLRIEMDRFGAITIMSPTGSNGGRINFKLNTLFGNWATADGSGEGFDSSTGFTLPNGAMRSPDLSWIKTARWLAIPIEQRKKFAVICPDFVVEIRSDTDRLPKLQAKMEEYIENGAQLGWLIEPDAKRVHIYTPDHPVRVLEHPQQVSGDPLLKGFVLNTKEIFS